MDVNTAYVRSTWIYWGCFWLLSWASKWRHSTKPTVGSETISPVGLEGKTIQQCRSSVQLKHENAFFLIQKGLEVSSRGNRHPELNHMEAREIARYIWKYPLHIYIPLKKHVKDAISINTNKAVWFQFSGKINILLSIISVTFNALVYHPCRLISIIAVLKQQ